MGLEHNETPAIEEVETNEQEASNDSEQLGENYLNVLEEHYTDSPEKQNEDIDAELAKMSTEQLHSLVEKGKPENPAVKRAMEILDSLEN